MNQSADKTDIIIAGYPKSGCTWLTRLVAELVGCPVVGLLNSDYDEMAREGLDRKSEFQCFKTHHQLHELRGIVTDDRHKVIYVVRDPRDVALSGAPFFFIVRWPFLVKFFGIFPNGTEIYRKYVNFFVTSKSCRIERMIHAVLKGSKQIHHQIPIPWAEHYRPYIENQYFFVKYEDLLDHPERECQRILGYLGMVRSDLQVREAIENQSFGKRKKEFLKNKDVPKAKFLRRGRKEQWRQDLSESQKNMFIRFLKDDLERLGYPTDEAG